MTEQNNLPEITSVGSAGSTDGSVGGTGSTHGEGSGTDETQQMPQPSVQDAWTQPFTTAATSTPAANAAQPQPSYQPPEQSQQSYNDYKAEQRRLKAAWKQQQRASRAYAREASHNGYPGSAAPNGAQWSQYANQYVRAQPVYRTGPNVAAIVWGGIILVAGAIALVWFLVPSLFVSANIWAILLSIGFAVIGLSLVIGAIVTSFSEMRKKRSVSTQTEDSSADSDSYNDLSDVSDRDEF